MTKDEQDIIVRHLDALYSHATELSDLCSAYDDPLFEHEFPSKLLELMRVCYPVVDRLADLALDFNCSLE